MTTKIALDLALVDKIRPAVSHVWEQIAFDSIQACQECGEPMDSEGALEAALDANYLTTFGHKDIDDYMDQVFKDHDYEKVMKFLNKHIRLDTCV